MKELYSLSGSGSLRTSDQYLFRSRYLSFLRCPICGKIFFFFFRLCFTDFAPGDFRRPVPGIVFVDGSNNYNKTLKICSLQRPGLQRVMADQYNPQSTGVDKFYFICMFILQHVQAHHQYHELYDENTLLTIHPNLPSSSRLPCRAKTCSVGQPSFAGRRLPPLLLSYLCRRHEIPVRHCETY